jgi:hypothetical protein
MSIAGMTTPPVTNRRWAGLATIALVAAIAMGFVLLTRAGAQATTSSITVNPTSATGLLGARHSMTVTVFPVQIGVRVRSEVLSGPNEGEQLTGLSDSAGEVVLSYVGDEGTGTDAIVIWADLDLDGARDLTEPQTAAIIRWTTSPVSGISLAPSTATNPIGTTHRMTAMITPAQPGVIVRFRVVSGPNLSDQRIATTDAAGAAAFRYDGLGGVGVDSILTWADLNRNGLLDADEPRDTATATWVTSTSSGLSLAPGTDTNLIGTTHTLIATLSPARASVLVRFSVSSGPNAGELGLGLTDASGRTTYGYVGDGGLGTDVIVAWIDLDGDGRRDSNESSVTATKKWITSGTQSIVATPQSDSNPIGTTHTVRATVSPVEVGAVVRFRINAGPHVGANRRALTNSAGQATYSYLGSRAGTDSITVWVDRDDDGILDGGEPRTFASKVWTTTVPAKTISLLPFNDLALLGSTHTVTATTAPVQSGVIVRFLVSMGPNKGDSGVAVTNGQGQARFSYLGNGGVGTDAIVSWLDLNNNGFRETNEAQASAIQRWVSSQVTGIAATPTNSTGPVNTQHTVTATVSPTAPGVLVRFRITQGPNLGDQGSVSTNSNGRASFSYFGNGGVGSDLILVWADFDGDNVVDPGEPQGASIRSWTEVAGSAFSLSPPNDTNPVNTRHSMTATVSPAQRNLLVRFEVTAGPNEGTRGSDDTNSSGRADLSYVGDGGIGTDVIIAWVDFDRDGRIDAGEPQAVATKQWTQAVARSLVIAPTQDTNPVNTRHEFTGTVNPAQRDLKVRFEVTAGPNEGTKGSDETNSNGRADLSYVGDEGVGTDVILAWVDLDRDGRLDAGEPQAIATKHWVAPTVSALALSPPIDEERVGSTHKVTAQLSPKQSGVLIRFSVISGPNEGERDRDRTDRNGRATDSYRGNGGVGTDLILAWADLDEDGVLDPGEHQATALVVWTGDLDDAARAREICDNLDHYGHPSLPTLCGLIESGKLSDHSEGVIIGVILKNAEKSTGRWGRDHDDHDHDDD